MSGLVLSFFLFFFFWGWISPEPGDLFLSPCGAEAAIAVSFFFFSYSNFSRLYEAISFFFPPPAFSDAG